MIMSQPALREGRRQRTGRLLWVMALIGAFFLWTPSGHAQAYSCSGGGDVDYMNNIEQTVCLSGDVTGLDSYVEVDDYDYVSGPQVNVVEVGADGQIYDGSWNMVSDSGEQQGGQDSNAYAYGWLANPQVSVWYTLLGLYDECVDPTASDSFPCYWTGLQWGEQTQLQLTGRSAPTLSFISSATLIAAGLPVTFTATITSGATGQVDFYDNGNYLGTATISGTNATFTTSSLSLGSHTITANYDGDANYIPIASSNSVVISVITPLPNPQISSLNPSSGNAGLAVTVSGSNFGATEGLSTVSFNGSTAVVLNWSDSSITAIVPGSATTGPVVVTFSDTQTSNSLTFTVNSSPCP